MSYDEFKSTKLLQLEQCLKYLSKNAQLQMNHAQIHHRLEQMQEKINNYRIYKHSLYNAKKKMQLSESKGEDMSRNIANKLDMMPECPLISTSVFVPISTFSMDICNARSCLNIAIEKSDEANAYLKDDINTNTSMSEMHSSTPQFCITICIESVRIAKDISFAHNLQAALKLFVKQENVQTALFDSKIQNKLASDVVCSTIDWGESSTLKYYIDISTCDPHSILQEVELEVSISRQNNTDQSQEMSLLGVAQIPLLLLETSLANEYSMCRWFPLKCSSSLRMPQIEVRLNVKYLMSPNSYHGRSGATAVYPLISYQPPTTHDSSTPVIEIEQRPGQNRRLRRRKDKNAPTKTRSKIIDSSCSGDSNQLDLPKIEKRQATASNGILNVSNSVRNRKMQLDSTYDEKNSLNETMDERDKEKKVHNSANDEAITTIIPNNNSRNIKSYLKRKPGEVIIRKLDWSKVPSKTDSNRITHAKSSKSRVHVSRSAWSKSTEKTSNMENIQLPSSQFQHPIPRNTALTNLRSSLLACCSLTEELLPLARIKYQAQQRSFVKELKVDYTASQTNNIPGINTEANSRTGNPLKWVSNDSIASLWTDLSADDSGSVYVEMLSSLSQSRVQKSQLLDGFRFK